MKNRALCQESTKFGRDEFCNVVKNSDMEACIAKYHENEAQR